MLASGASSITFRLVEIHFFVTLVCWIVSTWTLISVKQANRAAEVARLEHDLHTDANEKLKQKEQLERNIAEIIRVHAQVAGGHLGARVHLADGKNVLWQVAVPLNNLLGRHQSAIRIAEERDGYAQVLNHLVEEFPAIRKKATQYLHEVRSAKSQPVTIPFL
jgi:hypothetical protein